MILVEHGDYRAGCEFQINRQSVSNSISHPIRYAIWLYHRLNQRQNNIKDLSIERGATVSQESATHSTVRRSL